MKALNVCKDTAEVLSIFIVKFTFKVIVSFSCESADSTRCPCFPQLERTFKKDIKAFKSWEKINVQIVQV